MSHTLVLSLPEEAYQELVRSANEKGELPESVAASILAGNLADPVMKLSGCISTPFTDVGERHDEYIGAGLLLQPENI